MRALAWVEPWDEGITKIQGAAPYFSNALTLELYPTHNLYLVFFFLHTSSRQRMVMHFCPLRGGLYVFWSIDKKVMKLFIHPHESYRVASNL